MNTVGAYEAKTHLARLLERAEAGETIIITKHGHGVAKLSPADPQAIDPSEVIQALHAARTGVRLGTESIRAMIDDGRR